MNLSGLPDVLQQVEAYRAAQQALAAGAGRVAAPPWGVLAAARPFIVAALARDVGRPILLLTARSDQARVWVEQLQAWLGEDEQVQHLADPDALPYERINWSRETRQWRLRALSALAKGAGDGPRVVVASARALAQKTLPPRELRLSLRKIRRGQPVNLSTLLQQWLGLGYVHMPVVDEPGTFSRRGGIVDIWSPTLPYPVRLEFFGDEVESLRYFNPASQRTEQQLDEFVIAPASEALCKQGPLSPERLAALDIHTCQPIAREEYERELEQLAAGTSFRGMEFYLPYLYSQPASAIDYLPDDGILMVDDGAELAGMLDDLTAQAHQLHEELRADGLLPAGALRPFWTWDELQAVLLARRPTILGHTDLDRLPVDEVSPLAAVFSAGLHFGGQLRPMIDALEERRQRGERIVLVTRQASRISELLSNAGRPTSVEFEVPHAPPAASLTVAQGLLPDGWTLHAHGSAGDETLADSGDRPALLLLLTDGEIFGWVKPQPRRPVRRRAVSPESFFNDVQPDDFVVHYEHGIGQFRGLVRLTVDGMEREYLHVDYAQGDRLFVPVHQADRLSRYIGSSDAPPPLNRLGTADWNLVKARTQRAVADIADDLLQLYAQRETAQGHAFGPDTAWQQEMEASFPYVETEDQLAAIALVKRDMERSQPMDRLVCGDVGYGKTEVALRAAFKAVNDGKQVAVLVPTTVLAQQHWQTFSQRLGAFPVRIEMLSRFRSRAEQRKVLDALEDGKVDIVIGTHRLLQDDVGFKDLGLVIIDEEQRFGVAHKERLKQLRNEVDVLTLTATPIPRTLYMSLSGVRDLSTIDTPPEERLPVRTLLAEFDEALIRQAILREFDRDGQVFFVHDRVMGIENLAERIRKLVPEVRVGVAHGQMPEHDLEEMMVRFASAQIDVLVCTTIVESGLDIPNANTIIINRADHFGLAQLYQLRGRVGRGAVRAYCYLLYDRAAALSPQARRRLESILEANELGAGFRIAMDDLEMRGAGELLGARQHGHIAAVGFDLYCRLLAQAVKEQRTSRPVNGHGAAAPEPESPFDPMRPGVSLDLPLPMSIPESYVTEESLRLLLYRRMAGLHTLDAVMEMEKELSDRFGPPPIDVQNLLYSLRTRILAVQAGVEAISREDGQLVLKSDALEQLDRQQLQQRLGKLARVARRQVWMPLDGHPDWMARLEQLLTVWSRVAH